MDLAISLCMVNSIKQISEPKQYFVFLNRPTAARTSKVLCNLHFNLFS